MLFKKKESSLIAVCDGEIIPISRIPDDAFSQGILGQGYGVIPSSHMFFSPVNGTVISVSDTYHAYTLEDENGGEILVHIGIDTVELKGEFFTPLVSTGQKIRAGEGIAVAKLDEIEKRGYKTVSAVLITNSDEYKIERINFGFAKGGEVIALTYKRV